MSTITTINGSDVIANSRADINTNFSNLNTDKIETSTLDTDTTLAANSDSKIATQKAVKTYVDASVNPTGRSWNEYAADAGSTDAYAITVSGVSAYVTGQTFKFKANTANTGACTLNVSGLGAKTIKKDVTTDLATGDILANQIVTVTYDGTNMQLVSELSGTITTQNFTSNLPTPFFQQDLALSANDSLSTGEFTAGSMTDGSAFFLRVQGNGKLYRFQKDTATGLYYETHSITPTLTCTDNGAIINIGSYIYMFTHTGTNVTLSSRFLAADLTGEQVMTVPSVVQTGNCGVWSDGASAYVVSNSSQTTSRKWTVSGTTFTEASTATVTTATFAENQNSTMWDGTTAYMARMNMASPSIYKLTSIDGSSFSTTTRIKPIYSDVQYGSFIINIDTTKMYIGFMYPEYDEAGVISCRLYLIPVTKP